MAIRNNFRSLILVGIALCCFIVGASSQNNDTCSYNNRDRSNRNYIGVIAPVFTPFKNNTCKLNLDLLCSDVKYFSQIGVDGYLLASIPGEGYSLSTQETMTVYKTCVQRIKKMGKIYVQVGPPSLEGQKLARYAESLGVDGIFTIMSTYVNRQILSPQLITTGIKYIADCAPKTPVYFDVDPMAAIGLNVRYYEVFRLAAEQIKNFGGMCLSMEYAAQIRSYNIFNPQKQALIIRSHYSYNSASYFGYNGIVAVSTSLVPRLAVNTWYAKTPEEACINQDKINKFIAAIATPYSYLSATKTVYSLISGSYQGEVRIPVPRVSCEDKKRIAATLQAMGYPVRRSVTCTNEQQCYLC